MNRSEQPAPPVHYLACSYIASGGRRCPYPGSVSHGTLGGGPWLCSHHWQRSIGAYADAVVERAPPRITADPRRIAEHAMLARWQAYGFTAGDMPLGWQPDAAFFAEIRERIAGSVQSMP